MKTSVSPSTSSPIPFRFPCLVREKKGGSVALATGEKGGYVIHGDGSFARTFGYLFDPGLCSRWQDITGPNGNWEVVSSPVAITFDPAQS